MPPTPWAPSRARQVSETRRYASSGARRTATVANRTDGRWCTTTPTSPRRWRKPSACRRAKKGVVEGRGGSMSRPFLLPLFTQVRGRRRGVLGSSRRNNDDDDDDGA